jgi:hypothetical protein
MNRYVGWQDLIENNLEKIASDVKTFTEIPYIV